MNFDYYDIQALKQNYDIKTLTDYTRYAAEELARTKTRIDKYLIACNEQAQLVLETTFINEVIIERSGGWRGSKVYYYVSYKQRPVIPEEIQGHIYYPSTDSKRFGGKEKKQAFEYSQVLAKKYNAPVIRKGF